MWRSKALQGLGAGSALAGSALLLGAVGLSSVSADEVAAITVSAPQTQGRRETATAYATRPILRSHRSMPRLRRQERTHGADLPQCRPGDGDRDVAARRREVRRITAYPQLSIFRRVGRSRTVASSQQTTGVCP